MLNETAGKLRTYKLFKIHFKIESYLNLPVHLRVPLTKFGVSAHIMRSDDDDDQCKPATLIINLNHVREHYMTI